MAIVPLDLLLGSTAKVRVIRALVRDPGMTEAEVARCVRMSPNTVNLAVKDLEGAGVLERTGGGRGGRLRLAEDRADAQALRVLFREEAAIVPRLRAALKPVTGSNATCVLFGSVARGEAGAGSDADIMVVAPTFERGTAVCSDARMELRRWLPWPARFIIVTPRELRSKWDDPLFRNIRSEGLLLAGKPLEAWGP